MRRLIAVYLAVSMLIASGCGAIKSTNLTENRSRNEVKEHTMQTSEAAAFTDFSVNLLKNSMKEGENTLISPLSVIAALAMTANGAEGETLAQMEETFGMRMSELASYLHTYLENLPEDEKNKLSVANSIWFTDDADFSVNEDFLQTNMDYFDAEIYQTPFDFSTCKDINRWVEDNTDGMIKDILDQIPETAVMYLVNALAFEAEWPKAYEKSQVRDAEFMKEDGTKQKVELMYSSEYQYLEDEHATGFIKYYAGNKYAFAALLPEEGMSVEDYINTLDGDKLHTMLSQSENVSVDIAIPKFETEYDIEMSDVLKAMGMTDAFDKNKADFSKLGTHENGNIWINRVLHKTYISVAEKGTKAGAATVVEVVTESAMMEPEESKEVILDRPFVYMLIDCEQYLPFFVGTMMSVE